MCVQYCGKNWEILCLFFGPQAIKAIILLKNRQFEFKARRITDGGCGVKLKIKNDRINLDLFFSK
jgi:hypothetical protein